MSSKQSTLVLFVVGMHRSGTSALCAALAASGASFGKRLIGAMAGVNDEGFWEDAEVVAINEQLLALADSSWFAPAPGLAATNWEEPRFGVLREQASLLLRAGFGDAPLQAVKDPRLCLTLPFWLSLCEALAIPARVCVISRAPLEVARSLEKRDGFPLGYGLRLYLAYRTLVEKFVPADALQVHYADLVLDAPAVLERLAAVLPLVPDNVALAGAVRGDLQHQKTDATDLLSRADVSGARLADLANDIETRYPADQTLGELASKFIARGLELSQLGQAHAIALATLDQRDADVEALSAQHRQALATIDQRDVDIEALAAEHRTALTTIDERDEQIREFDRRLSTLGAEHSHALQVLRERDAELAWIKQRLETVSKIPGVGYLIRRLRNHAQG